MSYTHYAIQNSAGEFIRHWHADPEHDCDLCAKGVPLDSRPELQWADDTGKRIMLPKWTDDAPKPA